MKFNDNEKILLISDIHFGHKKMVKSCPEHFEQCRIYETIEEMDNDIIAKWNQQVDSDTIVIFLGDFLMSCPNKEIEDRVNSIFNSLNKPKQFFWIIGNHDHGLRKKFKNKIFMEDYLYFEFKGKNYLCQHFGFSENEFGYDDKVLNDLIATGNKVDVLVHGHTHSNQKISDTMRDDEHKVQNCVCWDAWYKLVDINELK